MIVLLERCDSMSYEDRNRRERFHFEYTADIASVQKQESLGAGSDMPAFIRKLATARCLFPIVRSPDTPALISRALPTHAIIRDFRSPKSAVSGVTVTDLSPVQPKIWTGPCNLCWMDIVSLCQALMLSFLD